MLALGIAPAVPAWGESPVAPRRPHHNLFGMTGLIDLPSAEVQPDAQLSFTSGYFGGFLRNTLSAQIFPGIEAAFRYSVLQDLLVPTPQQPESTLFDRSFDIKIQMITEGPAWPAVAVGLQDFLGTGVFSGEYIVATKNVVLDDIGRLKLTGGFGWGRFAGINGVTNPLTGLSDRFEVRGGSAGTGGTVNFGEYYSGENIGFFGGIEWQTPLKGLSIKAEYSSDEYARERANSDFDQNIPLNFGIEYRPTEGVEIGAYYMYGSEFGVRLTLSGNPFEPLAPDESGPGPLPVIQRPPADQTLAQRMLGDVQSLLSAAPAPTSFTEAGLSDVRVEERISGVRWAEATLPPSADDTCPATTAPAIDAQFGVIDAVTYRTADGRVLCTVALRPAGEAAIRLTRRANSRWPTGWHGDAAARGQIVGKLVAELEPDRIGLVGIELEPTRVTVYIENERFRQMPRAIGRTARVLSRHLPPSVETFEIVPVERSLPVVRVTVARGALEDQVDRPDAIRDSWLTAEVADGPVAVPAAARANVPDDPFPRFTWSINPAIPISLFDPDAPVRADLSVAGRAGVEVAPGLSLNAALQVRLVGTLDDIQRQSDSVLPRVRSDIANYLRDGNPAITRLTADYVFKLDDDIYARVTAGAMERMFAGVSGEVLWKPAGQSWGLGAELNWVQQRDFDQLFSFQDYDVVTGHASVYWDTGLYGIAAQVDAGRYLAGDYGGTITLKRRFANGWEIGGFATFTDVPFNEFGEGSFDKGLFLTIPFNWALPYETRSELDLVLRPLSRDGGQRLIVENRLYDMVEDQDRGGLRANWGGFWE